MINEFDEDEEDLKSTAKLVKHLQVLRPRPQAIKRLVNTVISSRGVTEIQAREEILQAWAGVCNPDLLKHTQVVTIRNRKLEIRVANSLINQQLTFEQQKLLRALQEKIPQAKLQGLQFRIGEISNADESS